MAESSAGPGCGGRRSGPTTAAQEQLWKAARQHEGSAFGNRPVGLWLHGPIDVAALRRCLRRLVARQPGLRTRYPVHGDGRVQEVLPEAELDLQVLDLTGVTEPREYLWRWLAEGALQPFDLAREPPLAAHLAILSGAEALLHLRCHHITFDAWSESVLVEQLSEALGDEATGVPPTMTPLASPIDLAIVQRRRFGSAAGVADRRAWAVELAGLAEVPELFPAAPDVDPTEPLATVERVLSPDVVGDLNRVARAQGSTLFVLLLAAFVATVYGRTRATDVVVGVPVATRTQVRALPVITHLVNEVPVRVDASGDPTAAELLDRVRRRFASVFARMETPFISVFEELREDGTIRADTPFSLYFQLRNVPTARHDPRSPLAIHPVHVPSGPGFLHLRIEADPGPPFVLRAHHRPSVCSSGDADAVLERLIAATRWLSTPMSRLSSLAK